MEDRKLHELGHMALNRLECINTPILVLLDEVGCEAQEQKGTLVLWEVLNCVDLEEVDEIMKGYNSMSITLLQLYLLECTAPITTQVKEVPGDDLQFVEQEHLAHPSKHPKEGKLQFIESRPLDEDIRDMRILWYYRDNVNYWI